MANKSFFNTMMREAARSQKQAAAASRQRQQQQIRVQREAERQALAKQRELDKEAKQRYLDERQAEAGEMNREIETTVKELRGLLDKRLKKKNAVSFDSLRMAEDMGEFVPPAEIAMPCAAPQSETFYASVKEPTGLGAKVPGARARYEKQMQEAEASFQTNYEDYRVAETQRMEKLQNLVAGYESKREAHRAKAIAKNQEVALFEENYSKGDPDAVTTYLFMNLESSNYPEGFPQEFRLAYIPESKELVVDYEMPQLAVVPEVLEYRYVKTKDDFTSKARIKAEIKEIYQDVVASLALRTISEVFETDLGGLVDVVVFNGNINTVDKATGKKIRPCLISVRVTRENFSELELSHVDKQICLRNLGAQVSPKPAEMVAVRPIIEFDMVDKRFVEEGDVLDGLEARPNLMELNPFEFENLVTNLFGKMGLESKLTRSSKDGGIDCVAFDQRPVVGGKVVIQAKRWKNTVGVSAVRDLYGTMMNEGANKGILVTTSGYGPDAFEFSKDKPIELIDGSGLLYHLEQIGVRARIIMPDEG